MGSVANSFEAQAPGTTITAGNSGGGSDIAFDVVQAPAGGSTLQFDNTHALDGAQALKVATTAADTCYCEWRPGAVTGPTIYSRIYMWWDAFPAANCNIERWLDSANANKCFFRINTTTGKIQWFNAANGTVGSASTNAVPLGQWCRVEATITASATVGTIDAALFFGADPNSTTPTETMSISSVNTGAADFARYRAGMITSTASIGPWWIDAWAMSTDGPIGPVGGGGAALATPAPLVSSAALVRASTW